MYHHIAIYIVDSTILARGTRPPCFSAKWNLVNYVTLMIYIDHYMFHGLDIYDKTIEQLSCLTPTLQFSSRFSGSGVGGLALRSFTIPTHSVSLRSSLLAIADLNWGLVKSKQVTLLYPSLC